MNTQKINILCVQADVLVNKSKFNWPSTEEGKRFHSEKMKKTWQDKDKRLEHGKKMKIAWQDEDKKRLQSERMKKLWQTNRKKWSFRCAQCAEKCESTWPKAKFCGAKCKGAYYRSRDQVSASNLRYIKAKERRREDRLDALLAFGS